MISKLWKILAWFYLIMQLIGLYYHIFVKPFWGNLYIIINYTIVSLFILELFLFLYKKYVVNRFFWKCFFFIGILGEYWYVLGTAFFAFLFIKDGNNIFTIIPVEKWIKLLISIIMHLPLYIAAFLYAFRDWHKKNIQPTSTNTAKQQEK